MTIKEEDYKIICPICKSRELIVHKIMLRKELYCYYFCLCSPTISYRLMHLKAFYPSFIISPKGETEGAILQPIAPSVPLIERGKI